ncbi:MAG: ankyrin repeat domain-containing protein [Marmoricola sp.]
MTHLSPDETARVIELSMHFAREGMTGELVGFLDHGLPVDVQDADGNTTLMLAAYHGHDVTVETLIHRGADVDLRNNRNQAPVAGALFKGEDAVVRLLIGAGADLDAGTPSARDTAAMFDRLELLG